MSFEAEKAACSPFVGTVGKALSRRDAPRSMGWIQGLVVRQDEAELKLLRIHCAENILRNQW